MILLINTLFFGVCANFWVIKRCNQLISYKICIYANICKHDNNYVSLINLYFLAFLYMVEKLTPSILAAPNQEPLFW